MVWDKVLSCSLDCPKTHSIDQAGLELIAIHLSLPLKCATIPGLNAFLISKAQVAHYFWACVRRNLKSSVVLAGKFYMQN